ncbi:CAP-Gly domain-containing linker protein 2 isoform X2 [Lingula anatina]|uniref:CAP-Gly domain-containing linker protein 2 isoform X2 n=1 Tax=Lingula anatina TaxID=7574 RepID=A0A1S3JG89_LINAN|nr:CAP-Gly domain-containing linker protein 2 isoform X2 [Lingula anatina]XP_013408914.1 CAP-Gly domain-containing linker protein 2 isoform X2 [Lingula anatina]|eukprot:XP_013408913.1 CAP-Gly domain-containing linker protein 2 isoform X2 [Lingula anatina]
MVLHSNINVNQRVEVKRNGSIYTGMVRYKGPLVTQAGDWVGVALDEPVGTHDGLFKGRRYFSCKDGHGIFTRAQQIRFIPLTRCLYNKYYCVSRKSYVDETLFGNTSKPEPDDRPYDPISISGDYTRRAKSAFFDSEDMYARPKSYHLSHRVSNRIPAATMTRPYTSMSQYSYYSTPISSEYALDRDSFISSPSIPKIHMPHSALKRQVSRGWENSHYVREMSVASGRDSAKLLQWNDISA